MFASGLFVACRNHLAFAFIDPGDHDITEACKPRHLHGQRMAAAPRRAAGRWPTAGPAHRRRAPAPVLERLHAPGAERPAAAGAAVVGDALAGTALAAVDAAGAPRCLWPAAPPAPAAVRARPARGARPAYSLSRMRACWPVAALAASPPGALEVGMLGGRALAPCACSAAAGLVTGRVKDLQPLPWSGSAALQRPQGDAGDAVSAYFAPPPFRHLSRLAARHPGHHGQAEACTGQPKLAP